MADAAGGPGLPEQLIGCALTMRGRLSASHFDLHNLVFEENVVLQSSALHVLGTLRTDQLPYEWGRVFAIFNWDMVGWKSLANCLSFSTLS